MRSLQGDIADSKSTTILLSKYLLTLENEEKMGVNSVMKFTGLCLHGLLERYIDGLQIRIIDCFCSD